MGERLTLSKKKIKRSIMLVVAEEKVHQAPLIFNECYPLMSRLQNNNPSLGGGISQNIKSTTDLQENKEERV